MAAGINFQNRMSFTGTGSSSILTGNPNIHGFSSFKRE